MQTPKYCHGYLVCDARVHGQPDEDVYALE